ncbi:MAG: hypothetical protein H0X30_18275 [Anaerolineae bacterium]|nr:hypothetical protein [Anaerolineae bacterium]
MPEQQTVVSTSNHSRKRFRVFWFICRWWFTYGVFGGIAFVCGITPFVNLFCTDACRPSDLFTHGLFWAMMSLLEIVGAGGIIGIMAGLSVGILHAAFIRFWVYYPTNDLQSFRRKVIWSNLLIPTGLMVFSTIFLVSFTKDFSELPTILYVPVLSYAIAVVVGLLVSRKFLRWWL